MVSMLESCKLCEKRQSHLHHCNDVDSDKLTKDRRLCSQNVNARHHRTYEIHTRARRLVSGPLHATCIVTCPFFFFFFFFFKRFRLKRSLSAKQSEMWQCKR